MRQDLRTCLSCGWVHFGISRKFAEAQVKGFNKWYKEQTKEVQDCYGGESKVSDVETCLFCGGPHTNFRKAEPGDCPAGVTINPIIWEEL